MSYDKILLLHLLEKKIPFVIHATSLIGRRLKLTSLKIFKEKFTTH